MAKHLRVLLSYYIKSQKLTTPVPRDVEQSFVFHQYLFTNTIVHALIQIHTILGQNF